MRKKHHLKLTEDEILQIAEAILTEQRPDVMRRAAAIRLLATGERPSAVARRMSVHPETIRLWVQRFRQNGYEGLADQPRRRRKRKADRAYCRALDESIHHAPRELGYPSAGWTVELLRDHLEQVTGTCLSCSRLRMLIRKRGYTVKQLKFGLTEP